jgi:hypothetical protein
VRQPRRSRGQHGQIVAGKLNHSSRHSASAGKTESSGRRILRYGSPVESKFNRTDVVVVGAGPAGLTAAITCAAAGVPTTLIGTSPSDNRTTALLASSVIALETLGVWAH